MNQAEKRSSRFRFSLGSLLVTITLIGVFLGLLRLKSQAMRNESFLTWLRGLLAIDVFEGELSFLVSQIASLITAAVIVYCWRRPRVLWFYIGAHLAWLTVVLLTLIPGNAVSLDNWVQNTLLFVLFYEPLFALSAVIVAWFQVAWRRRIQSILAMTFLLFLSVWSEALATIALDSFAGALAAAVSSR